MALGLLESYNRTRYVEELLEKTENQPPSLTIHLHPEHWVLNNGSKFLYHNQIASLLDDIRAHRIPVDFLDLFDNARVPFYEGCMVVELLDYRAKRSKDPQPEKPDRTRVILHPNPETLYADICSLNQKSGGKWTDRDAFEVEAKLLLSTAPPLCLDPNPHLSRIANHVLRASTPTVPMSLKRKATTQEPEEDETEKIRRAKIMSFMAPRHNRQTPSFSFYETVGRHRREKHIEAKNQAQNPSPIPNHPYLLGPPPRLPVPDLPTPVSVSAPKTPVEQDNRAVANGTPQATFVTPAYAATANATQTHKFVPQQVPVPNGGTAMTPQVYANVHAATEAAAAQRNSTPVNQPAISGMTHDQQQQLHIIQKMHAHHNKLLPQRVPIATQRALIAQVDTIQAQAAAQAQAQAQTQATLGQAQGTANSPGPQTAAVTPGSATSGSGPQGYTQAPNQYLSQQNQQPRPSSTIPPPVASSSSGQPPTPNGQTQAGQPTGVAQPGPGKAPLVSTNPNPQQYLQYLMMQFQTARQSYQIAIAAAQQQPGDPRLQQSVVTAQTAMAAAQTRYATVSTQWNRAIAQKHLAAANAQGSAAQSAVSGGTPAIVDAMTAQSGGRATPQTMNAAVDTLSAAPTPSPARASPMPGVHGQPGQNVAVQQQNQAVLQQQYQRTITPVQPQQLQPNQQGSQQAPNAQFTFVSPYNAAGLRSGTPSQQQAHMLAVAQANAAKLNAGTPVPGGNPLGTAQHSPQQIQQQNLMQQQQLRTPQMQTQQLRTPQMQTQQLRTPQMQTQQLRTPQMQQQQPRTPQSQHQQPQAQQQRQPTPQQSMPQSIQATPHLQHAQMQQAQQGSPAQQLGQGLTPQQQAVYQQQQQQHFQYTYGYYPAVQPHPQQQQGQQQQTGQPRMTQQQVFWMQQQLAMRNGQAGAGNLSVGQQLVQNLQAGAQGPMNLQQQHHSSQVIAARVAHLAKQQQQQR